MEVNPDRLEILAEQAQQLVRRSLGRHVSVSDPILIRAGTRSVVMRCAVAGWDGVESLVVKHNTGDDVRGFTDWASLRFLSEIEDAQSIAPRFYAGDPRARIFVMEDLGGSYSLADVLGAGDVATVVRVLRALAHPMARLVAATSGREQDFVRIRTALPGAMEWGRRHETERWLAGRSHVEDWATTLDLRLPSGFGRAFSHVAEVYAEPGPYLAFSHGDPAPSNNHIHGDRVRLVDFEYGGYRHALYDITAWYVLCPLPTVWLAEMEDVFRQALAMTSAGGLIHDEERYREAWATMCAYRALAMLTWFPHDLLALNREWTPGWTMWEALISTTLRLYQATAEVAPLAPLAQLGMDMAAAVRRRWPELGDGTLRWPGVAGYL